MNNRNLLVETVTEALADPSIQRVLADAVSARLQHKLAGEALYIPKGTRGQRSDRDAQIRRDLDAGKQPAELQNAYRVSLRTIYRIKRRRVA